ncbi:hypothetical protein [Hymenobacter nivis]|uniref:Uncharacterized protein n=1 Tax=Hymenobacter nivis TaxID=1850093 RepID=A0A502G8U3_9BACT|nr:hypothetical protein [Hymenobacter nivis]TPG58435.1 hypothetical protein EAH73_22290 [Hymenobacter nivis]
MKKRALVKSTPVVLPSIPPIIATPALATKAHGGPPRYGDYGYPPAAPALPAPNHRAEGGNAYDLSHEQTGLYAPTYS